MNIPLADAINLLHAADHGVLATHSTQLPGYPYATLLPFVVDERHCPVFLVSALAEHTKNLVADARVSFVVSAPEAGGVLASARMTLLGRAQRIEPGEEFVARYLRYQPEAQRYLALADFAFFRLQPQRLRAIAGFGAMGWIDVEAFAQAAWIDAGHEAQLLRDAPDVIEPRLLGIDPYGADMMCHDRRERRTFAGSPVASEQLRNKLARALQS